MQHFPNKKQISLPEEEDATLAPDIAAPHMLDRAELRLTSIIGALFSVGSFLCLIAISVLGLFFVEIVAEGGETGMLPILSALGLSFVLGMLLLDFTHARSLSGYRAAREANARASKAIASVVLFVLLGMIHPVMAAAIPLAAGAGWLGHVLLHRFSRDEPLWDFLPKEAVSVLTGRDGIGLEMSGTRPPEHVMAAPVSRAGSAIAVVAALASGSYLVAQDIMTQAAFVPLVFGSLWASQAIISYAEGKLSRRDTPRAPAARVERIERDHDQPEHLGLDIQGLMVRDPRGKTLLADINIQVDPGQITGIVGPSGAGKSLLMHAVADPFSISNAETSGSVRIGQTDLWRRENTEQTAPVVLLPPDPIMLPATGADNLTCFHDGEILTRGKWYLERLVFAVDTVEDICNAPNAQTLPSMQVKALAMARAFLLSPPLYLLDRPEDGLPDKQVAALVHRLKQEARLGRSVLMTTNNRALLDSCNRLIVMHEGRVVDFGPANDVLSRMDSGWSRFLGLRHPDTEEVLINWIHSHFHRTGDQANQRKVSGIASDMLALSYQTADARNPGEVQFLFKHFQGHCVLRMSDNDPPLGNGAIRIAETDANSDVEDRELSILGSIMRHTMKVEFDVKQENRRITAQIETYDPRKTGGAPHGG